MATEYVGNVIPAPGFRIGNVTEGGELLQSMNVGINQKGVTLKAGQGVLKLGTLLARETSTKKYVRYNNAGSDGTNVVRGVLRHSVDTNTEPERLGNIVKAGVLNLALITSANSSGALAAAVTALLARTDDVANTFTF